jgi:hypothetical protein
LKGFVTAFFVLFFPFSLLLAQTKTDVLILGGGASGTAAGVQAARMGVTATIVEETPWLGGMLTSAGVSAIDGNHDLHSGFFGEFVDALEKHYGGPEKLATGWVSSVLYEPSVGAKILRDFTKREKNLMVLLETRWGTPVRTAQGWRVEIIPKTGPKRTLLARQLIDGTELGDVAAALGVPADIGMEARSVTSEPVAPERANGIIQDLTFVATLKDYGPGTDRTIPKPTGYSREEFICSCRKFCPDTTRPRLHPCDKMLTYGQLPNGKVMLNWPIDGNDYFANLVTASPTERERLVAAAKQHTLRYVYFIQHDLGYKNLGLADDEYPTPDHLPMLPYHRESRRIRGVVRFTMAHIAQPFATNLYRTGIAVGNYPIDHHHAKYPAGVPDLHFVPVPSYGLPAGTLLPQALDNFIVAEKSISVSNLANGTTRLQPVTLQIGQAAGVMAALAVQQGTPPRELPVRAIQNELLKAKGYLMPYLDVPTTHPHWAAIQRIGATGFLKGTPESFKWMNRTWFRPDSTVTMRELVQGEREVLGAAASAEASEMKLTVKQALDELTRSAQRAGWAVRPMNAFSGTPNRLITRAELAVLVDELLDPFHRRAVDWEGNFLGVKSEK